MKPMKTGFVFEVGKLYLNGYGDRLRCLCVDRPTNNNLPIILMNVDNGSTNYFRPDGQFNTVDPCKYDIVGEAPETASLIRYYYLYIEKKEVRFSLCVVKAVAEQERLNLLSQGYRVTEVGELKLEGEFNG